MSRLLLTLLLLSFSASALAQEVTDVGVTGFLDAVHYADSPVAERRGVTGFTYRRIYLTTDFLLAEDFSGRFRLSADEGTVDARGPLVYIKDAYVSWQYAAQHRATLGVMPVPIISIPEIIWGYRSLERTVVDISPYATSRDFGIRADGSLDDRRALRYTLLVGNNADVRPETDRHKRYYAHLAYDTGSVLAAAGTNYASYGDARSGAWMLNATLGSRMGAARIGLDTFLNITQYQDDSSDTDWGGSLFGALPLAADWSLVARADRFTTRGATREAITGTLGILALAYQPAPSIRIMPNIYALSRENAANDDIRLRLTVEINV